jgi:hypothetical protein
MPRKSRSALPTLHIEALSTGKLVGLDDEFTGQPIAQPLAQPRKTSAELRKVATKQREQQRLSVLVDAGLGPLVGYALKRKQVELVPKDKRKIGELNGQAILIDAPPKPPWRRY